MIDVLVGFIPILGSFADNYWKSNLKNLDLLEKWLLDPTSRATRYHILLMPDVPEFIPPASKVKAEGRRGWFGGSGLDNDEMQARAEEVQTGRVRKTRRMGKEECIPVGADGTVPKTRPDPVVEPLD